MTNTTAMSADGFVPPSEMDFHALVAHVKSTFAKHASKLIFVTATDNTSFNSVYLDNLPEHEHDGHNCFTCRDFLKRFGGLVYVDRQGVLRSAVWDETDAPEGYGPTVKALREKAEAGKIAKRFFSEEEILGTEHKGERAGQAWEHFNVPRPEKAVIGITETVPGQEAEAALRKRLFAESLGEFKDDLLKDAMHQFTYDPELARREGQDKLLEMYIEARTAVKAANGKERTNLIWWWSNRLPRGAATITNTALGEFLAMLPSNEKLARSRYLEATRSDNYMRPSAEATEGAINAAEKLIATLGLTTALKRRAATLDDIPEEIWVWKHPEEEAKADEPGGVFDKLRKQTVEQPNRPIQGPNKDWGEFVRDILPQAKSVQYQLGGHRTNFGRFVTQADPEANPILIWDKPEKRNPFSHYVYVGRDWLGNPVSGSLPKQWNLPETGYVKVTGVLPVPHAWYKDNMPEGYTYGEMFVLEGAREVESRGLGLFPQIVTRELYPVRTVIENFSNTTEMDRAEEGEFAGIILNQGFDANGPVARFLVELDTGLVLFNITRWN